LGELHLKSDIAVIIKAIPWLAMPSAICPFFCFGWGAAIPLLQSDVCLIKGVGKEISEKARPTCDIGNCAEKCTRKSLKNN